MPATTNTFRAASEVANGVRDASKVANGVVKTASRGGQALQKAEEIAPTIAKITSKLAPIFDEAGPLAAPIGVARTLAPYATPVTVGLTTVAGTVETAAKAYEGDTHGAIESGVKTGCQVGLTLAGSAIGPEGTVGGAVVGQLVCGRIAGPVTDGLYAVRDAFRDVTSGAFMTRAMAAQAATASVMQQPAAALQR